MAKGKKIDLSWLTPKGAVGEAKRNAAADKAEREAAEKSSKSIILRQDDVRGDYDAKRVLHTTLDGKARPITQADLKAFRQNMRLLQGRLSAEGITAQQVLEMARVHPMVSTVDESTDLSRARKQIRVAVPTFANVGRTQNGGAVLDLRLVTNSGPESKHARHHVHVRFFGFGPVLRAFMSTPTVGPGKKPEKGALTLPAAVKRIQQGYLAFDCDCERHRYVYRYISTIGGFNAGRAETGYPKITNPKLYGVACKHVLRAMGEVSSSRQVGKFIGDALTRAARQTAGPIQVQAKKDAVRAQARRQHSRQRDLEKLSMRPVNKALAAKVALKSPDKSKNLAKLPISRMDVAGRMRAFQAQVGERKARLMMGTGKSED